MKTLEEWKHRYMEALNVLRAPLSWDIDENPRSITVSSYAGDVVLNFPGEDDPDVFSMDCRVWVPEDHQLPYRVVQAAADSTADTLIGGVRGWLLEPRLACFELGMLAAGEGELPRAEHLVAVLPRSKKTLDHASSRFNRLIMGIPEPA